jgi:hypothetical protein
VGGLGNDQALDIGVQSRVPDGPQDLLQVSEDVQGGSKLRPRYAQAHPRLQATRDLQPSPFQEYMQITVFTLLAIQPLFVSNAIDGIHTPIIALTAHSSEGISKQLTFQPLNS